MGMVLTRQYRYVLTAQEGSAPKFCLRKFCAYCAVATLAATAINPKVEMRISMPLNNPKQLILFLRSRVSFQLKKKRKGGEKDEKEAPTVNLARRENAKLNERSSPHGLRRCKP
jgi:hypothetical protein